MSTDEEPQKPSLETLHRRAEKGWRYRDIERSWTHFVWTLIMTTQTIFLGIIGIVAAENTNAVPSALLVIVFVLTFLQFGIFYGLSVWRRAIDVAWADHFEQSVRASEVGETYNNRETDQRQKCSESYYGKASRIMEPTAVVMLLTTAGCLAWAL